MNEKDIKELRAHAGKLVTNGEPLSGVFERRQIGSLNWLMWAAPYAIPRFDNGDEWRIAQPKKQPIDWSHPYFKRCAVSIENFGDKQVFELVSVSSSGESMVVQPNLRSYFPKKSALRLATPANEDSNWQYFSSSPENDAKLRELAKMVKVEVRYWDRVEYRFDSILYGPHMALENMCNYRITGECQDGWTDKKEEVQS